MRAKMELIMKDAFRGLALRMRYDKGLTQHKMAEALVMSARSYEDIECGNNACGALSVCLLLMQCEDANAFLEDLQKQFEKEYALFELST